VYVQHRLKERAKEVNELLLKKAYFYVCGDAANMAREVNAILAQILAEQRGISEAKAEEIVKNMRAANQYQVRGKGLGRTAYLLLRDILPSQGPPCDSASKHFFTNTCVFYNRRMSGHKKRSTASS
jgi:hypothetical protein